MSDKITFNKNEALKSFTRIIEAKPDLLPQYSSGKDAANGIIEFIETLAPYIVSRD